MHQIIVKPEILVLSRLRVLYDVVDQLTRSFCVQDQQTVSDIIRKGILERQYLSAVHIYLIDKKNLRLADIALEIDWNIHRVKIKSGQDEFHLDSDRSVSDQVSSIFPLITKHINSMKNAFGIVRSEVWYTFRGDVQRQEAMKYCGTVDKTSPAFSETIADEDTVFLEFISEALQELRVTIHHKKQPEDSKPLGQFGKRP